MVYIKNISDRNILSRA